LLDSRARLPYFLRVAVTDQHRGTCEVKERVCWNCGHFQEHHTIAGGCSFAREGGEPCDCPRYEDSEYSGEQRKRDTYTLSDRRRLSLRKSRR
jgi:hypothetical protein